MKKQPIFLLLAALGLAGCGDTPEPPTAATPAPAEIRSPAPTTVTLPQTGDITMGALTPSTQSVRIPSEAEKSQALNGLLNQVKTAQAAALKDARIVVNGAWPYSGYSTLAPDPAAAIPARLVAVDLTVSGHTVAFDPDDIEIVDGVTSISYGSDPHATPLSGAGEIVTDPKQIPVPPAPTRLLLIYAFPKGTRSFTLYYWGQKLLPEARPFDDASSGWGLPFPDPAK